MKFHFIALFCCSMFWPSQVSQIGGNGVAGASLVGGNGATGSFILGGTTPPVNAQLPLFWATTKASVSVPSYDVTKTLGTDYHLHDRRHLLASLQQAIATGARLPIKIGGWLFRTELWCRPAARSPARNWRFAR